MPKPGASVTYTIEEVDRVFSLLDTAGRFAQACEVGIRKGCPGIVFDSVSKAADILRAGRREGGE